MSDDTGSITNHFRALLTGDDDALANLWTRFFPRLTGLARRVLAGRPSGAGDAEDAVQKVFVAFWQQAQRGDLKADLHREDLWRLLATMATRHSLNQLRTEYTAKRGQGRIVSSSASDGSSAEDLGWLEAADNKLAPVDFDLQCEEMLTALDESCRAVVLLRLIGYANSEIADLLDCAERTIERKLQLARSQWKRLGQDA